MQLQSVHVKRSTAILFILINLSFSLCAIWTAVILHFHKVSGLRAQISQTLGYDGRSALEHFLVGYGGVLLGVILFSIQYFGSMRDQPKIHEDGSAGRRIRIAAQRWSAWVFSRDVRVAMIFGGIHLYGTVGWWEVKEAYFGANRMPARSKLQWDQIFSDILGVTMAVLHLKLLPSA